MSIVLSCHNLSRWPEEVRKPPEVTLTDTKVDFGPLETRSSHPYGGNVECLVIIELSTDLVPLVVG